MLTFKMTFSLSLCLIFLALMSDRGHAFYHSEGPLKTTLFQMERNFSSCANKKKTIIIYDNFNHFSAKRNHSLIIFPFSDDFVPSDLIECNSPIHVAIHQPMTPENSLANLVYANLMLRQLIEKHRSLHQRARKALHGLDVPFLNFQEYSFPNIPSRETSIDKQLRELYRSQQIAIRNPSSSILSNSAAEMSFYHRLRKYKREPLYLACRSPSGMAKQKPLYLVKDPTEDSKNQQSSSTPSSNVRDEEKDKQPQTPITKRIELAYHKSELPWIVTYLIAHPFESALYLFLLCSIIFIVFSTKKS